jgi:signal transduction histidine kinase
MRRRGIDAQDETGFGDSATWIRVGRPRRAVLLIGSVVIGLIIAGALLIAMELRAREVRSSRRELQALNTVLAEEASRALQSVDLVLVSLVDRFRTEPAATPETFRDRNSGQATHDLFKSKLGSLPQLDAVTLIGTDGQLINFSRYFPIPPVDLSDRDYYAALSKADVTEPFLSAPVENRGNGSWTIYLVRRVTASNGTLLGFVLGAIDLRYFSDFFRSLDLARGSAISLWRRDGSILLARYPAGPAIGVPYATPAVKNITEQNGVMVYENPAALDGESRLVSRRLVPNYPLVMVVSYTLRNVLADWRNQVALTGITSGLAVLAVLVLMVALTRQFATYEALARAVREREAAIMAREQAEGRLRQSQKLEAMGQLTSGIAHDFNNFLTVVIGNLEMIVRRLPNADDPVRRLAEGALAGAARAAGLTQRLLAFSRRQDIDPARVDVGELVTGMSDILRQTLGTSVTLHFELAASLWPIFIDGNQLESALLNLVVNARDACPHGGAVTIRARNHPATGGLPDCVELAVADTGTGMEPDIMHKVFEPFFTTKEPGRGTGLGLAQVHDLVLKAGGDVTVDSVVGRGTSIRLVLPRFQEASEAGAGVPAPVAAPTSIQAAGGI